MLGFTVIVDSEIVFVADVAGSAVRWELVDRDFRKMSREFGCCIQWGHFHGGKGGSGRSAHGGVVPSISMMVVLVESSSNGGNIKIGVDVNGSNDGQLR